MIRVIRRLLTLAAVAPAAIASGATALEADAAQAWAAASKDNTVAAYAEFAMSHPESRHAEEARRRISGRSASEEDKQTAMAIEAIPGMSKVPSFVPDSITFI